MSSEIFLLKKYGKSNYLGFNYLCYILEESTQLIKKIEDVYTKTALVNNVSRDSVERAIRYYMNQVESNLSVKEFVNNLLVEYWEVQR